jgi:hypothetical protein
MAVWVANAQAHLLLRLVSGTKMATVLGVTTVEEKRSIMLLCVPKDRIPVRWEMFVT